MSYLSSLVPAADCSGPICSDGLQSDTSNGTSTANRSLQLESETDSYQSHQSSLTCVSSFSPVRPSNTEELRTWLQQAFPASHSRSPVDAKQKTTSETCGPQQRMSFASFDRGASCWRTCQASLVLDMPEQSSVTWPQWATWDGTDAYPLPTPEPVTSARDGGLWPTPVSSDTGSRKSRYAQGGTPLSLAARTWPTPLRRDSRTVKGAARSVNAMGTEPLITEVAKEEGLESGRLNPDWIEWLMGWPLGWSDASKPLAMDKFQEWLSQHMPLYQASEEAA